MTLKKIKKAKRQLGQEHHQPRRSIMYFGSNLSEFDHKVQLKLCKNVSLSADWSDYEARKKKLQLTKFLQTYEHAIQNLTSELNL
jgi:hypothetical protein